MGHVGHGSRKVTNFRVWIVYLRLRCGELDTSRSRGLSSSSSPSAPLCCRSWRHRRADTTRNRRIRKREARCAGHRWGSTGDAGGHRSNRGPRTSHTTVLGRRTHSLNDTATIRQAHSQRQNAAKTVQHCLARITLGPDFRKILSRIYDHKFVIT